jgi:hypothetical protein
MVTGMPDAAPGSSVTLAYAAGGSSRRVPLRLLLIVSLAVGGVAAWGGGRTARELAQQNLHEWQAGRHVEPAERVVLDLDADRAADLLAAGSHEGLTPPDRPEATPAARVPEPTAASVFAEAAGPAEGATEQDGHGALLFLHELTSPQGVRRTVVIRFLPWVVQAPAGGWSPAAAGLVAQIYDTRGLLREPTHLATSRAPLLLDAARPDADVYDLLADAGLRWFAGQPDATDPSHFTLEYEFADGRRGTVDGHLSADGNAVRLAVRTAL